MNRLTILCLSVLFFFSCDPSKRLAKTDTDDGIIRFGILHINDVYEIEALEGGKVGGMSRVAQLYKDLKAEGQPILFVHAGDFLNPSLLGSLKYEGERIKGRQMVEVMNASGVDLVAFGNHEFDLDEDELQERINESNFTWIGTSVRLNIEGTPKPFYKEQNGYRVDCEDGYNWFIQDADGTKIQVGIFSSTVAANPRDYVHYLDPFESAIQTAENLQKDCDIVLGLTHLNMVQDLKLAGMLQNVPLLMGGHDHDNIQEMVGETMVCKADANAKTAYFYQFTYNTKTGETSLEPRLIPVTDQMDRDPEVAKLVKKWQTIQDAVIKQVIPDPDQIVYHTEVPLDGRESSIRNFQTNLGTLMTLSMAQASRKKTDAVFFNSGSIRIDDQLKGDVLAVDIFRVLPFGGSMVESDMTGALLIRILEAGRENKGTGGFLQVLNLKEVEDTWYINDVAIDPEAVYHIAFTDFLLTGFENRLDFMTPDNPGYISIDIPKPNDPTDLRSDIRKTLIEYMLKQ
ncbi:MAG: bifunctional metallophosphatase/5'-nucleotidase [Saprospiraceae bacterium]|nr:bifunctional metallophosphatase/5'-nucleotidase [Saprospiraceae bacterium]